MKKKSKITEVRYLSDKKAIWLVIIFGIILPILGAIYALFTNLPK